MENALLRLQRASPRLPARSLPMSRRIAAAAVVHAVAGAVLLSLAPPARPLHVERQHAPAQHLTWIYTVPPDGLGIRGGGGGGGNRQPAPAAPHPASRQVMVPAIPERAPVVPPISLPAMTIAVDAAPVAFTHLALIGIPVSGGVSGGVGRGDGIGGGFGEGEGEGIGSGSGSGIGPGAGGGTGEGVYRAGGGVTAPVVVSQVRPTYPAEAMRYRAQGSVAFDVIVRRDGTPAVVRVVRPIDRGPLDAEAERAVRQWRFLPGRLNGAPVDVLVTVIIDFVLY